MSGEILSKFVKDSQGKKLMNMLEKLIGKPLVEFIEKIIANSFTKKNTAKFFLMKITKKTLEIFLNETL